MPEPRTDSLRIGKLLLKGDPRSIELLLRTHAPAVLAQLSKRFYGVLTREDLEDAISEALNAIWFARTRFDPKRGSVFDWFYQTSLHLAVDAARRRHRERVLAGEGHVLDTIMGAAAHDDVPAEYAQDGRASLFEHVRAIIHNLPPAQRAIVLADIKHYPRPAPSRLFGSELGVDHDSIPVYRGRAHKKIREELERLGYRF